MKFATSSRIIEFTVEKRETLSTRRTLSVIISWCDGCGRETKMSEPEDAAEILQVRKRAIYAGIEAGKTHFNEADDGGLLVCLHSITQNHELPG